ncbi:MAG: ComEC/Rec2 family competence protein [Treponema sp.]|nr:ComEC/Rec2 family competence protein [Candidatus Treponema equi]
MVEKLKTRILNPFVAASVALAVCVLCGVVRIGHRHPFQCLLLPEKIRVIEGTVCSNPSKISSDRFYIVKVRADNVSGNLSYAAGTKSGASGIVTCLVPTDIVEALYPGRLFSSFGHAILMESGEKVFLEGRFSGDMFICRKARYLGYEDSVHGRIKHFRSLCRLQFKRLLFGWSKAGGFILALLSGSREYTEKSLGENFRRAGLSHILALSGMHLSFFAGLAGGAGRKIFGKKISFWFRLLGIIVFAWFAGLSPSLLRALLCSLVMLLCSVVFSTEVDYFIVLCAVFLLHCSMAPDHMVSSAFILSYCALAGILVFGEFFEKITTPVVPKKVSASLAASCGAQCATAPASIVMFGTFTPWGIISSVLVSPMVSIFLAAAVVSIIACLLLPFLSPLFGCIMNLMYRIIAVIVQLLALVPPITIKEP